MFEEQVQSVSCRRVGLTLDDRLATSTRSDGHLWEVLEYDVVVLVEVEQGE